MAYRVRIDKQSCQSSGNCVDAAPEAFAFDADELGDPQAAARELPLARLLAIARRCPALAISIWREDDGTEVEL